MDADREIAQAIQRELKLKAEKLRGACKKCEGEGLIPCEGYSKEGLTCHSCTMPRTLCKERQCIYCTPEYELLMAKAKEFEWHDFCSAPVYQKYGYQTYHMWVCSCGKDGIITNGKELNKIHSNPQFTIESMVEAMKDLDRWVEFVEWQSILVRDTVGAIISTQSRFGKNSNQAIQFSIGDFREMCRIIKAVIYTTRELLAQAITSFLGRNK